MYQINHFILMNPKKKRINETLKFTIFNTDNRQYKTFMVLLRSIWWFRYLRSTIFTVAKARWILYMVTFALFFSQSKSQSYVSFQNNIYYKSTTTKFKMNAPLDEIKFLSKIEIGQKKITLKIEILSRNISIRQREEILVL